MLYFCTFDNPNLSFQWCFLILWNSQQTELRASLCSSEWQSLLFYALFEIGRARSPLMTVQLMTICLSTLCHQIIENALLSYFWQSQPALSVILPHPVKLPANRTQWWAPWPNGRPADIDSISDQWSKVPNIAIFSQKIRKDLNLNIDQSLDIWWKPSKDRNFLQKKIKGFKSRSWTFKTP